ncbi:MAG: cytochrome-c peroxidase [Thiolinea sp.]
MRKDILLSGGCLLILTACQSGDDPVLPNTPPPPTRHSTSPPAPLDQSLQALISQYGLSGNPAQDIEIPDSRSPMAELGRKLFFSRSLSGDLDVACASCHHPMLGGGDNLSLPIGTNSLRTGLLGLGRRHESPDGPDVPRNAPTTFNIALWKRSLFHDGRIERLADGNITTPDQPYPQPDPLAGGDLVQAQARFPITSDSEMRGSHFDAGGSSQSCREKLAERLGGYGSQTTALSPAVHDYWLQAFRTAFNAPDGLPNTLITEQNISAALSAYQRSQLFINNAWSAYIQGQEDALSDKAKQGALLFYRQTTENGYGCVNCHSGDFLAMNNFITP